MKLRLKSTREIYGIEPETLRDLPYKEALQLKLEGVKKTYGDAVTREFEMYKAKNPYEELAEQNEWIKYLQKARILTELQIEELKEHYDGS